jgi:hypothetical protein
VVKLTQLAEKVLAGGHLTNKEVDYVLDDMMSDPAKLSAYQKMLHHPENWLHHDEDHEKLVAAVKAESDDEVNFTDTPFTNPDLVNHLVAAGALAYECLKDPEWGAVQPPESWEVAPPGLAKLSFYGYLQHKLDWELIYAAPYHLTPKDHPVEYAWELMICSGLECGIGLDGELSELRPAVRRAFPNISQAEFVAAMMHTEISVTGAQSHPNQIELTVHSYLPLDVRAVLKGMISLLLHPPAPKLNTPLAHKPIGCLHGRLRRGL